MRIKSATPPPRQGNRKSPESEKKLAWLHAHPNEWIVWAKRPYPAKVPIYCRGQNYWHRYSGTVKRGCVTLYIVYIGEKK